MLCTVFVLAEPTSQSNGRKQRHEQTRRLWSGKSGKLALRHTHHRNFAHHTSHPHPRHTPYTTQERRTSPIRFVSIANHLILVYPRTSAYSVTTSSTLHALQHHEKKGRGGLHRTEHHHVGSGVTGQRYCTLWPNLIMRQLQPQQVCVPL